ncbi:MAG: hypothetical protein M1480_12610 [Bacteroidetes bacterium]|nr:hypothetical protein [Bacteroidota bacterium]
MKYFELLLAALILIVFSSCSYDVSKDQREAKTENVQIKTQTKYPARIQENQSTVLAEIEGVYGRSKEDFFIKARIIKVDENQAYSSMAIPGASYILVPSFQLDDKQKIMTSEKNKSLFGLAKLRAGDTFKAIIFFEQFKGWYIDKVLE